MFLGCCELDRKNTSDAHGLYVSNRTTKGRDSAAANLGKIKFVPEYAKEIE